VYDLNTWKSPWRVCNVAFDNHFQLSAFCDGCDPNLFTMWWWHRYRNLCALNITSPSPYKSSLITQPLSTFLATSRVLFKRLVETVSNAQGLFQCWAVKKQHQITQGSQSSSSTYNHGYYKIKNLISNIWQRFQRNLKESILIFSCSTQNLFKQIE
jgi:hypothetical protein